MTRENTDGAKRITGDSETLFIPLYGKANMQSFGEILTDRKAQEIVSSVDYDFSRVEKNRYLNLYMGIRAAIFDRYAAQFIKAHPDALALHLGCGLDARIERVQEQAKLWVDLDLPEVIEVRRRYYQTRAGYRMLGSSVADLSWLDQIEYGGEPVLILAEGLTMYLSDEENRALFAAFAERFSYARYVFDAYSVSAARWSKRKNPVNRMGAVIRWGLDDPHEMESAADRVRHVETRYFSDREWVDRLTGSTRFWFRALYGGRFAKKLYRIYCYDIGAPSPA